MTHARTKSPTQQRTYGVLVGTIRDGQEDPAGHSRHYEIWVEAASPTTIASTGTARCSFALQAAKPSSLFVRFSVQSTTTDDRGDPS